MPIPRRTHRSGWTRPLAALAIGVGASVGVAAFTFDYAEGTSYLSNEPQVCANCHVMQSYLDSWQRSGHHHVAVCNDCHLPHEFPWKYVAKADNGLFHSYAFTTGDFPEKILIKERNRRIVRENCEACHARLADAALASSPHAPDGLSCLHCHGDVGHGD